MRISDVTAAHSIAPLKNVSALMTLVETLVGRSAGLPGLGVGSGPSGYGKTVAAQFCQNQLGVTYIEARSFWSSKVFCENLLVELGGRPSGTLAKMMEQIIDRVADLNRPLIIDEADKLVEKRQIELVRDIYETTQVPIILLGEEELPTKLAAFERVHNRVLDWVLFQPCDFADTRALAELILGRGIHIADDLIEAVRVKTSGRTRRVATTLFQVRTFAIQHGLTAINQATYRGKFETGLIPRREQRVG